MAINKTKSKDVSNVETKAVGGNKQSLSQIEETAESDDRKSVFIRISQEANEILTKAAKAPRTKATVIEALLKNFDDITDQELKNRILSGQAKNPLEAHGELLELRSWAEHAFENDRYVWAGEMYKTLANHPSSSEGLKNICNFRLSVCLIRLSYAVREEALKESIDKDVYDLALDTLNEAIAYTEKLEDKLGNNLHIPKLVLHYNLASCRSLKAQYMVEAELDPSSILVDRLRSAAKQDSGAKEDVWKTIGETWRNNRKERKIDVEAEKAFYELQKIFPLSEQDSSWRERDKQFSERIWMVDSANKDEDFIFLRSDKQTWSPKFERWTDLALEGRQPYAEAVRALINRPRR